MTGSYVPFNCLEKRRATYMPVATKPVIRLPLGLSQGTAWTLVLTTVGKSYRHLIDGSLSLASLFHT
jgi:hypothetical protein